MAWAGHAWGGGQRSPGARQGGTPRNPTEQSRGGEAAFCAEPDEQRGRPSPGRLQGPVASPGSAAGGGRRRETVGGGFPSLLAVPTSSRGQENKRQKKQLCGKKEISTCPASRSASKREEKKSAPPPLNRDQRLSPHQPGPAPPVWELQSGSEAPGDPAQRPSCPGPSAPPTGGPKGNISVRPGRPWRARRHGFHRNQIKSKHLRNERSGRKESGPANARGEATWGCRKNDGEWGRPCHPPPRHSWADIGSGRGGRVTCCHPSISSLSDTGQMS